MKKIENWRIADKLEYEQILERFQHIQIFELKWEI